MPRLSFRLVLAVFLLIISLTVLAWSFLPGARTVRRQKIEPSEMQLPTPAGYLSAPLQLVMLGIPNSPYQRLIVIDDFL